MGHAVRITTPATLELVEWDDEKSYDIIRDGVGGTIERVRLAQTVDMWVGDDFLLRDPVPPLNLYATFLIREWHIGHRMEGTRIMGNVIVCGSDGPDSTALDPRMVVSLFDLIGLEIPKEYK